MNEQFLTKGFSHEVPGLKFIWQQLKVIFND